MGSMSKILENDTIRVNFTVCPLWLLWDSYLGPKGIIVWLHLLSYAGQKGYCWPSLGTLAKASGLSRSAVIRALKKLEQRKLIRKETVPGRSSYYHLNSVPDCYLDLIIEEDGRAEDTPAYQSYAESITDRALYKRFASSFKLLDGTDIAVLEAEIDAELCDETDEDEICDETSSKEFQDNFEREMLFEEGFDNDK